MNTMTIPTTGIYVACLSAYNNGKLHGAWIDAHQDVDAIHAEIKAMLQASPEPDAEEWAIHDHNGFEGFSLSESHNLEEISEMAAVLNEENGAVIIKLMDNLGLFEIRDAKKYYEDNYHGEWDKFQDYAEDLLHSCGELDGLPDVLKCYFDYEGYARDLSYDYIQIKHDGKIHVFSHC